MLTLSQVRHVYGDTVVLDIDELTVAAGTFVSIVGPSGCGKSTLLRIIAGLIRPSHGTVSLEGRPVPDTPGFAGFMPQHDRLLPWRNALDNAVLAADIAGIDHATSRARATKLFDRFGLAGYEGAWPHELSGGMRQRLAMLRTFLTDRDLLLLDEPFGALDAITRRRMHRWLQEVLATDARTVIFVTHDVDEAILLSDRLLVLSTSPGRISADLTIDTPRPRDAADLSDPTRLQLRAQAFAALEAAGTG